MFLQKKPCHIPCVLDLIDFPPFNNDHDIMSYPKYYDALYYPELYPEIFFSADTIKNWLESSLTSHTAVCKICVPVSCVSQINFFSSLPKLVLSGLFFCEQ